MVRLLLFLIAVSLIATPAVRERIEPHAHWLVDPVHRWSVRGEVGKIARLLEAEYAAGRPLPDYRGLARFLRHVYSREEESLDPWNTPFFLTRDDRGMYVASAGPDRAPHTADDIRSTGLQLREH